MSDVRKVGGGDPWPRPEDAFPEWLLTLAKDALAEQRRCDEGNYTYRHRLMDYVGVHPDFIVRLIENEDDRMALLVEDLGKTKRERDRLRNWLWRPSMSLNDCKYLTLQANDEDQTIRGDCSCGKWYEETTPDDEYRAAVFKMDTITHNWVLRHRRGER